MSWTLFDDFKEPHIPEPEYNYRSISINQKINYKSAPMFRYGSKKYTTIECAYRDPNPYGLNKGYLDYSLSPND